MARGKTSVNNTATPSVQNLLDALQDTHGYTLEYDSRLRDKQNTLRSSISDLQRKLMRDPKLLKMQAELQDLELMEREAKFKARDEVLRLSTMVRTKGATPEVCEQVAGFVESCIGK